MGLPRSGVVSIIALQLGEPRSPARNAASRVPPRLGERIWGKEVVFRGVVM